MAVITFMFYTLCVLVLFCCMIIIILGCAYVVQVECREVFGADIFIKFREYMQMKFAPTYERVLKGTDDMLYIKVPKFAVRDLVNEKLKDSEGVKHE